jgi:hypothetical protein
LAEALLLRVVCMTMTPWMSGLNLGAIQPCAPADCLVVLSPASLYQRCRSFNRFCVTFSLQLSLISPMCPIIEHPVHRDFQITKGEW